MLVKAKQQDVRNTLLPILKYVQISQNEIAAIVVTYLKGVVAFSSIN